MTNMDRVSYVLAITLRLNNHDVNRFEELYPLISQLYSGVSVASPPEQDSQLVERLSNLPKVKFLMSKQADENRRYITIQQALEFKTATHIHYCDGDHLLSRMKQYLEDWKVMLMMMSKVDCLIIGRSPSVFESYPPPLRETEKIINQVASYLLRREVDLGAGTRGLSRRAVEFLVKHASPQAHGVTTDAEWPILLQRAGFRLDTLESTGAIYEIMNEEHKMQLESVKQWSKRVKLARMIIQAGIDAASCDLPTIE